MSACETCEYKISKVSGFWMCLVHMLTVYNPKRAGCSSHSSYDELIINQGDDTHEKGTLIYGTLGQSLRGKAMQKAFKTPPGRKQRTT